MIKNLIFLKFTLFKDKKSKFILKVNSKNLNLY